MKIVIIGGSGLIGSKLTDILRGRGHDVLPASLYLSGKRDGRHECRQRGVRSNCLGRHQHAPNGSGKSP